MWDVDDIVIIIVVSTVSLVLEIVGTFEFMGTAISISRILISLKEFW
jgi:hypothetical protein